jgi:hypothetical protein
MPKRKKSPRGAIESWVGNVKSEENAPQHQPKWFVMLKTCRIEKVEVILIYEVPKCRKSWTYRKKYGNIFLYKGEDGSMYMNEIAPKTKITLETFVGEKRILTETAVANITSAADKSMLSGVRKAKPNAQYAVLDPVRRNDKLVNFAGNGVNNHMLALIGGQNLTIWKNISVLNMKLPSYGSVHVVLSTREGTPFDRRKSERVELDCTGMLKIRTTEKELTYEIGMMNMSESGIAFSTNEMHGLEKGSGCLIDFSIDGASFHFDVVVVRVEKDGHNHIVGCRIRQRSGPVATYIKQRKKAKKAQNEQTEQA